MVRAWKPAHPRAHVLTAAGVPVDIQGIEKGFFVQDPDGFIVEVTQLTPLPPAAATTTGNLFGASVEITIADTDQTVKFYRDVLGFQLRGDRLTVSPVIPDDWDGFEIVYRHGATVYEIAVRRRAPNEARIMEIDGHEAQHSWIQLTGDGGTHHVTVWIPRGSAMPSRPQSKPVEARENGMPESIPGNVGIGTR